MLAIAGSKEAQELGEVARVSTWLLEIDRFDFKPNPKTSIREQNRGCEQLEEAMTRPSVEETTELLM